MSDRQGPNISIYDPFSINILIQSNLFSETMNLKQTFSEFTVAVAQVTMIG